MGLMGSGSKPSKAPPPSCRHLTTSRSRRWSSMRCVHLLQGPEALEVSIEPGSGRTKKTRNLAMTSKDYILHR